MPSAAFKNEGTAVVTDIVFLRKRGPGEEAHHADPDWEHVAPLEIEGSLPGQPLFPESPGAGPRDWTAKDTLYGEGYSVTGNGDLAEQLREAVGRLPKLAPDAGPRRDHPPERAFTPPPPLKHITEGSFFIRDDRTICQSLDGLSVPVVYGGTTLTAYGSLTGKRLAALVGLRDRARRVLQSQNEGWPEEHRNEARRELNRAYDRFIHLWPDQQDHLRRDEGRPRHPADAQYR